MVSLLFYEKVYFLTTQIFAMNRAKNSKYLQRKSRKNALAVV